MANDTKMLNLDKVKARLAQVPEFVQDAVAYQLEDEVNSLVEAMKRAAPVQTGTLRETIKAVPATKPLSYIVSAGGPATTRKVGSRTYDRGVRLGSGDTAGRHKVKFVGEDVTFDYARGDEFGHKTPAGNEVPAHPFFFVIYRALKKGMRRRMSAAGLKAVRQLYPKGG